VTAKQVDKQVADIHAAVLRLATQQQATIASLRAALERIVAHQDYIGGGLAVLSATRNIAADALQEEWSSLEQSALSDEEFNRIRDNLAKNESQDD
jgi:phosphoribosylformylglycinamidine (FGAM) synthase-like enzyme